MVSTEKESAPYAPVANVLSVIRRARERGVPNPMTLQELERIGIPSGNAPRTLVALKYLGLLSEDGEQTASFDRLKRATTGEYADVLAEIVKAAYRKVFQIVNPAEHGETNISDAFRGFQPEAQRGRMITLFMALCKEAGIVEGGPPSAAPRARRSGTAPKPALGAAKAKPAAHPKKKEKEREEEERRDGDVDYRLLSVLMQRLPRNGKWTKAERDKWLQAINANIDLLIEVVN